MLDFEEKLNMHFYKEYGGISSWVGDGFCDDINNNKACDYDDGDCCGWESMKKNFCVQCICKGKACGYDDGDCCRLSKKKNFCVFNAFVKVKQTALEWWK